MGQKESNSVWQKTRTQKLIRYAPKGTYYAYFKVGGKPFRKSLETDVYSVAKLRLADEVREQREVADAALDQAAGKLTFADVIQLYRDRVESEPRLKPASRRYRAMTIDFYHQNLAVSAHEKNRKGNLSGLRRMVAAVSGPLRRANSRTALSGLRNCQKHQT
jgi:hypothetical protein